MDKTDKPLNIGLIQRGSVDWVGGIELEKNLVEATLRYAESAGKEVTFTLLGPLGAGTGEGTVSGDALRKVQRFQWPPPEDYDGGITEPKKRFSLFSRPDPEEEAAEARRTERRRKGKYLGDLGIDFLYPPFRIPTGFKPKSAAWLCDFQHKFLPEYFSAEEVSRRDDLFGAIAARFKTVVVSSETACEDFRRFYPESPADLISLPFRVILPTALSEHDCRETVARYHLPERFFIVCNQFWKHKNHAVVFDALEKLVESDPDCHVVLTGRFHDDRERLYTEEILGALHRRNLSRNVSILGLVPKEDQLQLIRAAIAVIQPSFFEGWSTIVEESHALGADMILSDLPVHREQSHPSAVFFDPTDAGQLGEAMAEAWKTSAPGCSSLDEGYPDLVMDFGRRFYELAKSHQEAGA